MGKQHKIFISWSGKRSHYVAEALRTWLPMVIQSVGEPFMSDHMEKGTRSMATLSGALEGTKVGVVCLTPENLTAPWVLYESGALSKTINDDTRLCTYLVGGLKPSEVEQPLGMFQATRADRDDTRKLVHTINRAVNPEEPLPENRVDELFNLAWPTLEEKLKAMPTPETIVDPKRSDSDMLAEVLETVRGLAQKEQNRGQLLHRDAMRERLMRQSDLWDSMGKEAIQPLQDMRNPTLIDTVLAFIQTLNDLGVKKAPPAKSEEPSNPEDYDGPET